MEELKIRFNEKSENTIFAKNATKNLPLDGLQVFIDKTWDVIRNQKELNLPDQREMVANFRCNEIKQDAINLVTKAINQLRIKCEGGVVLSFGPDCQAILGEARGHFEENANQYKGTVYKKVALELQTHLFA